jgi:hypothetical protein
MALDRRYEPGIGRYLPSVIGYPLVFWLIILLTVIVGLPRAMLRARPGGHLGEPGSRDGATGMTPHDVLIENRRRLPWAFRWRDRCLTIALWGLWWAPVGTIPHLFANESARWVAFLADLGQVAGIAAVAVTAMVAWGMYDRSWGQSAAYPDDPTSRSRRTVFRRSRRTRSRAPIALGREACRGAGRRVMGSGSVLALGSTRPDWPPPCSRGWRGDLARHRSA